MGIANGLFHALQGCLEGRQAASYGHVTQVEDIRRLVQAMKEYRGFTVVKAALWFSIYTLARPGEIRHAGIGGLAGQSF